LRTACAGTEPTSQDEEVLVSTWLWVILALAVVVIVVLAMATAIRSRRSEILRTGFGPEYDRTVERAGDQSAAEAELVEDDTADATRQNRPRRRLPVRFPGAGGACQVTSLARRPVRTSSTCRNWSS
jgi:hypothetical protein